MQKIFISHSTEDRSFVESDIIPVLDECHISYWYSKKDIRSATEWEREILRGLKECDWFLVVLSPNSISSRWVKAEVDWAVEKRFGKIASVLVGPCDPADLHLMLHQLHYFDFSKEVETGRTELSLWAKAMMPSSSDLTVIAVMGTKGGVGKSSIIAAMAQLIASNGKDVAVIDTDLEAGGVSAFLGGWADKRPAVWSVLDAAYAKQSETSLPVAADLGLWNVTPGSLKAESQFGRLYLIPARLGHDNRQGYLAVANLKNRNFTALAILKELISRLQHLPQNIGCVFVDCGAENNPMVSAAFVLSKYGYLVSHPSPEFAKSIPRLQVLHRENFPDAEVAPMNVIVNMATPKTAEQWPAQAYFIPEEPSMREVSTEGRPIDFMERFKGVGLNRFYFSVLNVLRNTFDSKDQALLPDEVEVWIRPYLQAMQTFPEMVLRRPLYRFRRLLAACSIILAMIVIAVGGMTYHDSNQFTWNVTSQIEIYKPAEDSNDIIAQEWNKIIAYPELEKKLSITGATLTIRGTLNEVELNLIKRTIKYPPISYAIIEGLEKNRREIEQLSIYKMQDKRLGIFLSLLGVVLCGSVIYFNNILSRRIILLKGIVNTRTNAASMKIFIEEFIRKEGGKQRLAWLHNIFRQLHPTLTEESSDKFFRV